MLDMTAFLKRDTTAYLELRARATMSGGDTGPGPNAIDLAPGVWIEPADMSVSFVRSRGPGGQAVNKLSTKAELRVRVGGIRGLSPAAASRLRRAAGRRYARDDDELITTSDTHRSQVRNRQACLDRLRQLIVRALPDPIPRKRTRPSRGAIERRLASKREQSQKKQRRGRVRGDD
jgi:ribosome-associated protein